MYPDLPHNIDVYFNQNKKRLLHPGEKVELFVVSTKDCRVLITDEEFQETICEFRSSKEFEKDPLGMLGFPVAETSEFWNEYDYLGMLPIKNTLLCVRAKYLWRIKITPPEEKTTETTPPE